MTAMLPRSLASLNEEHALYACASFLRSLAVLAVAFSTATILSAQESKEPIKNDRVVAMTKAGIDDATIVKVIEAGGTEWDASPAALIALKSAGVSNRVIDAIVSAAHSKSGTANGLYARLEEIGVYVNLRERPVPLRIEIINWRSGGALKQALTWSRGHLNGLVNKPLSALRLEPSPSPEFIIYCPEGASAEEYQLLRFWEKRDRREFRLTTGGVVHASSGADMNAMQVDIDRLGPRLYRVTASYPLQAGEYGFLPPGAALSASAASAGKIYTFAITGTKR
jgi:hypothetical protein